MGKVSKDSAQVAVTDDEVFLSEKQLDTLLDRAERSRELLGDLIFSLMKWLVASLLALNSGGAIAVLNFGSLEKAALILVGLFYTAGITCAMLCAFISLFTVSRFLPDQGQLLFLSPGVHKKESIDRIANGEEAPPVWRDPILWTGWLSFVFFVAGSVMFVIRMPVS